MEQKEKIKLRDYSLGGPHGQPMTLSSQEFMGGKVHVLHAKRGTEDQDQAEHANTARFLGSLAEELSERLRVWGPPEPRYKV